MTDKIPSYIKKLMMNRICPVCQKSMDKKNGKPTHDKIQSMACEKTLRGWLNIQKQTIIVNGKVYEVDAKFI